MFSSRPKTVPPPDRLHRSSVTWHAAFVVVLALLASVAVIGASAAAEDENYAQADDEWASLFELPRDVADSSSQPPVDAPTSQQAVFEVGIQRLPPPDGEVAVGSLTLTDVEQLALANNPALSVARANVSAARGRQVQAGLYPNPVIGYSGNEIGNEGTAGKQGGFVGQRFVTGGKLRLDRAVAGQEVRESRYQFDAQELRVLSDVRLRFYDSLVAQREIELTDELVRIGDRFVELSGRLVSAQQLSQNDLLQAEIEAEESDILAQIARNKATEAWQRLAAAVGIPGLALTPLTGDLDQNIPTYDWEESYMMVMAQNPELAAARTRVRRTRLAIERARRQNIPDIDLLVAGHHMNISHDDVVGVEVGFPLPILDRNQGNIMRAESEWIAAQNDVERIELSLQDRLAVAYRRYSDARQQVQRYQREIIPRAQQSLDLVSRGYASGQVDFLTLLISQRTYIRVNLAYLASLSELWQAVTVIEGQLLTGSLQSDMSALTPAPSRGVGKM